MRRKIGFLAFLLIVLMAGTFFYVYENGNTFYAYINDQNELEKNAYGETFHTEYSQDGIVELVNTEYIDNNVKLTFKAVKPGDTLVTIQYRSKNLSSEDAAFVDTSRFYELHVGPLSIITEGKHFANFNGFSYLILAGGIWLLALAIVLLISIRKMVKEAQFTYKMSNAAGMLLLSLGLGAALCINYYYCEIKPWNYSVGLYDVYEGLMAAIELFVFYTAPVIILFAIAIVISNLILMIRDRFRFSNILWIFLGVLTAAIALFLVGNESYGPAWLHTGRKGIMLMSAANSAFGYLECMLAGTVFGTVAASKHIPKYNKKFIIIPGCGMGKDGKLNPSFYNRVDKAVGFYQEQLKKKGRKAVFIVTGGKDLKGKNSNEKEKNADKNITETEAMKNCLIEKEIPKEDILVEDKSSTIYDSMSNSKKIIDEKNPKGRVIFATSGHLVFSSSLSAKKAGLNAEGIGCHAKWYCWIDTWAKMILGMLLKLPYLMELIVMLAAVLIFGWFNLK